MGKWERSKEERDFLFAFRDEGNVRRRRRGIPWNSALSNGRERERERMERKDGDRKNSKKGKKKRKWTE